MWEKALTLFDVTNKGMIENHLEVVVVSETCEVLVYGDLGKKARRSIRSARGKNPAEIVAIAWNSIKGRGLVVTTHERRDMHFTGIEMSIRLPTTETPQYEPPSGFIHVDGTGVMRIVHFTPTEGAIICEKSLKVGESEHIILPVNSFSYGPAETLPHAIAGFHPDLRTRLVNSVQQPSAALARLIEGAGSQGFGNDYGSRDQRKPKGQHGFVASLSNRVGDFFDSMARSFMALFAVGIVAIAALVGVALWQFWVHFGEDGTGFFADDEQVATQPAKKLPDGTAKSVLNLEDALGAVFEAANTSENETIKGISSEMFRDWEGRGATTNQKHLSSNPYIAWALLAVLWETREPGSLQVDGTIDSNGSGLKELLRAKHLKPADVEAAYTDDERAMAAWWFCEAFSIPGVPTSDDGSSKAALWFENVETCEALIATHETTIIRAQDRFAAELRAAEEPAEPGIPEAAGGTAD